MDYEKKYNEALKWMRELYPGLHGATKEDAEHYFPELRESEDERIIKTLQEYVKNRNWRLDGPSQGEVLAWLEKQKGLDKMIVVSPEVWDNAISDAFENGKREGEKQKEQKPTSTEDMPYITDEHFYEREPADSFKYKLAEYMTKCCTKNEGPYGYTYGISAEAILKMAEEELLKRGVVQKSAEWSEEDDKMLQRIIRHTESEYQDWCNDKYGNSEIVSDGKRSCLERLDWLEKRLKSLRPQPHKEIYQAAKRDLVIKFMNYLDENRPEGKMSLSNGECEDIDKAFKEGDWAKIIRYIKKYQPHWKPSEEQPDFPITDEQIKEFLVTHPKIEVPEKYKNPDWLFKKQEQPEVDLEKEIRSMWEKCNPTDEGMGVESTYMHIEAFDIIARHFALWGAEHLKK